MGMFLENKLDVMHSSIRILSIKSVGSRMCLMFRSFLVKMKNIVFVSSPMGGSGWVGQIRSLCKIIKISAYLLLSGVGIVETDDKFAVVFAGIKVVKQSSLAVTNVQETWRLRRESGNDFAHLSAFELNEDTLTSLVGSLLSSGSGRSSLVTKKMLAFDLIGLKIFLCGLAGTQ